MVLLVRVVEGVGHRGDLRPQLLGGRDALQAAFVLRGPVDELALEQLHPGGGLDDVGVGGLRHLLHPLGVLVGPLVGLVERHELALEALDLAAGVVAGRELVVLVVEDAGGRLAHRHADGVDAEVGQLDRQLPGARRGHRRVGEEQVAHVLAGVAAEDVGRLPADAVAP